MNNLVMLEGGDYRIGKALQLYVEASPYLVIGDHVKDHSVLLEIFLIETNIPFKKEFLNLNKFGPQANSEEGLYRLVGAGWMDNIRNRWELSGESQIYRMSPNEKHASEISDIIGKQVIVKKPEPKLKEFGYASILKQIPQE